MSLASDALLDESLRMLTAVAFDVDGTLTDGKITWAANGEESKSFSFKDIMGISLLRRLGLTLALISGESTPQVDLFAKKMHIGFVAKGTRDKASALRLFAEPNGIPLQHLCFVGDDVNDLPAMEIAGLCACPANAAAEVSAYIAARSAAGTGIILSQSGGDGAVRELADRLLLARRLRGRDVFQMPTPER